MLHETLGKSYVLKSPGTKVARFTEMGLPSYACHALSLACGKCGLHTVRAWTQPEVQAVGQLLFPKQEI